MDKQTFEIAQDIRTQINYWKRQQDELSKITREVACSTRMTQALQIGDTAVTTLIQKLEAQFEQL